MSDKVLPISFNHVSLSVADLDAQVRWYAEAMGFTEVVERVELPDPPVRTAVLETANGLRIEMIERAGSERLASYADPLEASRAQGYGHWAVEVGDLDVYFSQIIGSGAAAVWPPADAAQPGTRFAYVQDPEGNLIELIQPGPTR
jgi:catechol 2,3-dioxygenase-like lactoylglutathione lyase family enzyme